MWEASKTVLRETGRLLHICITKNIDAENHDDNFRNIEKRTAKENQRI